MATNLSWSALLSQCSQPCQYGLSTPLHGTNYSFSDSTITEMQGVLSHYCSQWDSSNTNLTLGRPEVVEALQAMTVILQRQPSVWTDAILIGAANVLRALSRHLTKSLGHLPSDAYTAMVALISEHTAVVSTGAAPRLAALESLHGASIALAATYSIQLNGPLLDIAVSKMESIGPNARAVSAFGRMPSQAAMANCCTSLQVERAVAAAIIKPTLASNDVPPQYKKAMASAVQASGLLAELRQCLYLPQECLASCNELVQQFGRTGGQSNQNFISPVLPPGVPSVADLWLILHQTEATYQAEMESISDELYTEADICDTLSEELAKAKNEANQTYSQIVALLRQGGASLSTPVSGYPNSSANQSIEPVMALLLRGAVARMALEEGVQPSLVTANNKAGGQPRPSDHVVSQKENIPSFGAGKPTATSSGPGGPVRVTNQAGARGPSSFQARQHTNANTTYNNVNHFGNGHFGNVLSGHQQQHHENYAQQRLDYDLR